MKINRAFLSLFLSLCVSCAGDIDIFAINNFCYFNSKKYHANNLKRKKKTEIQHEISLKQLLLNYEFECASFILRDKTHKFTFFNALFFNEFQQFLRGI